LDYYDFKNFDWTFIEKCVFQNNKYLLVTVAPCPGIGKTTITKCLEQLLPESVRVNQDECGGKRNPFLKKLKEECEKNTTFVIVDKTNNTLQQRNDYQSLKRTIIYLNFYTTNDTTNDIANLAIDRIKSRGKYHLNLYYTPQTSSIINSFVKRFEPLDDTDTQIQLNPFEDTLKHLQKLQEYFKTKLDVDFNKIPFETVINNTKEYERSLANWKQSKYKKTRYWSIEYNSKDLEQFLKNFVLENPFTDFHTTLCFKPSEEENKYYSEFIGKEIKVKIVGIARDSKAVALVVEVDKKIKCQENSHITIATFNNTKPVYSLELIKKGNIEPLDPFYISGIVTSIIF
jgi:hypothetical protein